MSGQLALFDRHAPAPRGPVTGERANAAACPECGVALLRAVSIKDGVATETWDTDPRLCGFCARRT